MHVMIDSMQNLNKLMPVLLLHDISCGKICDSFFQIAKGGELFAKLFNYIVEKCIFKVETD